MISLVELLLIFLLIVFVFVSFNAPLESLGWWAGWFKRDKFSKKPEIDKSKPDNYDFYFIYLTGIGGFDGKEHGKYEQLFLNSFYSNFERVKLIDDIYPYSVLNKSLKGKKNLFGLWDKVLEQKEKGGIAGMLVNLRNVFQVLVSSDKRYGDIFDLGTAKLVLERLELEGYDLQNPKPIILFGYSGGGQVSVGCVNFLKRFVNTEVYVISLGGVFSSDAGISVLDHLHHIKGGKDNVEKIGSIIFPGRWGLLSTSHWNLARIENKVTIHDIENMKHTGPGGYFDDSIKESPISNLEKTTNLIKQIINEIRSTN